MNSAGVFGLCVPDVRVSSFADKTRGQTHSADANAPYGIYGSVPASRDASRNYRHDRSAFQALFTNIGPVQATDLLHGGRAEQYADGAKDRPLKCRRWVAAVLACRTWRKNR